MTATGVEPSPIRGDRPARLEDPYLLGALSGAAVVALAWSYPLWGGLLGVACPLRELTGIPCPTCFGTRAMLAAASGEWWKAVRFNPVVGVAGIGLFAYVPWALATVWADWPRPRLSAAAIRISALCGCAVAVGNWIYLVIAHP